MSGARFDDLDEDQKEVAASILKEASEDEEGRSETYEVAQRLDYEETPVGIRRFLEHEDYMGNATGGGAVPDGGEIYPFWMDKLQEIYDRRHSLTELIFTGSIGSGKSRNARHWVEYEFYRCLCLRDPTEYYLADELSFLLFSLTQGLADNKLYGKIMEDMLSSPWFREQGEEQEGQKNEWITFPEKSVKTKLGSTFTPGKGGSVGEDIFGGIMDEFSEAERKDDKHVTNDQKSEIIKQYTSVKRRMTSRFEMMGNLPGMLLLVSSVQDENAPLEKYIEKVENDDDVMIVRAALHEAKSFAFTDVTIPLSLGTEKSPPELLEDEEDVEEAKQKGAEIVEIPDNEDWKDDIRDDPISAVREYLGRDPASERRDKLVTMESDVDAAFVHDLPSMFDREYVEMGEQYGDVDLRTMADLSAVLNPRMPRAFAGDLSKGDTSRGNDPSGLAMCHVVPGSVMGEGFDHSRLIVYDFTIEIRAIKGDNIPIPTIQKFVFWLIENFNMKWVSFDGYQSLSTIQKLRMDDDVDEEAVTIKEKSVDKSKGPYDTLATGVKDGNTLVPYHEIALNELKAVEDFGAKYDHPPNANKDVSDAMAGAMWGIMNTPIAAVGKSGETLREMRQRRRRNRGDDESVDNMMSISNAAKQKDGKKDPHQNREQLERLLNRR